MTHVRALAIAAVLSFPAVTPAASDTSIRCERGLVRLGDLTVDLLGKCGPPTLRERSTVWNDTVAVNAAQGVGALERRSTEVERWTYDFGPSRFLMIATLCNGRITSIERGSYGYGLPRGVELPAPKVSRCDPALLRPGDTKVDALGRCGPPAASSSWMDVVPVEQWIYNLGPDQFLRIVRFEEGRVAKVETGGYGYAD
jgi:hypothetical protein